MVMFAALACVLALTPAATGASGGDPGRRRAPELHVRLGRNAARAADALPHARHAAKGRRRRRAQCRADHARHDRERRAVSRRQLRRRVVRPGPAARRGEVLHHPAGRHRPRRVEQAERRHAGALSALWLCRHGRGGVPPVDRRPAGEPSAARDGHVDGGHAHVAVGVALSGIRRRLDAARQPARTDLRPQPRLAPRRHRRDPQRSAVDARRLQDTAGEPPYRGGDAVAVWQQPGAPPERSADPRRRRPRARRVRRERHQDLRRQRRPLRARVVCRLRSRARVGEDHRAAAGDQLGRRSDQSA